MKLLFILLLACQAFADSIAVNNAAFVAGLSPFNWYKNGSSYVQAINPGAYFKVNFTGTSFAVVVDVSALVSGSVPAGQYPQLSWVIDGGSTSTYQILSSDTTVTLATGLVDTTHSIRVNLFSSDAYTNRWAGPMTLKITSITVGTGKALSAATLAPNGKAIFFGDSITEGAWILGAPNAPTYSLYSVYESCTLSYAALVAVYLNVEYGQCAFGGQGWDSGSLDVPVFPAAWNLIMSGVSRDFTGCNLVVINMGANGGVSSPTTVTIFLTNLRSALTSVSSTAQINLMIPFTGTGRTNITAGFNSYVAANPTDTRVYLVDLGSAAETICANPSYTWDGLHPNTTGDQILAALLEPVLTYLPPNAVAISTSNITTMHVGP